MKNIIVSFIVIVSLFLSTSNAEQMASPSKMEARCFQWAVDGDLPKSIIRKHDKAANELLSRDEFIFQQGIAVGYTLASNDFKKAAYKVYKKQCMDL
jgi:hypothetical protein